MLFVFKRGDRFIERFKTLLSEQNIRSAFFYGLGGFSRAELAFYDLKRKKYLTKKLKDTFEVASLIGNVAELSGEIVIHAHVVLGKRDFKTVAGHLVDGVIGGTLEVFLMPAEDKMVRKNDEMTGLALL